MIGESGKLTVRGDMLPEEGQILTGPQFSEPVRVETVRAANFYRAQLVGAHLQRTCLIGAHLRGANLAIASLDGANLRGAHLQGAELGESLGLEELR
jgi:uncharacterized protein YjbI with pentapeptide repeats